MNVRTVLCVVWALTSSFCFASTLDVHITRVPTNLLSGTLETRGSTVIRGLNDRGDYVGTFGERNGTIWDLQHGFIHTSIGRLPPFVGRDQDRWGPDGYRLGEVVGTSFTPGPLDLERYHYLDLAPAPYPSTFNDRVSTPNAINGDGVVVGGMSSDYLNRGPSVAFVYNSRNGDLELLSVPGAVSSVATDINSSGQIVGNFQDANFANHGFLYSDGAFSVIDMPGQVGRTRIGGINDAGTIVGSSFDVGDPRSFIYQGGVFSYFTADSLYTVASDINNADQIVGWVGVSGKRRGFLYEEGRTLILDLAENGTSSTYAYTINNLGVIGGSIQDQREAAFLATVVPEPSAANLFLAGLAALGLAFKLLRRSVPAVERSKVVTPFGALLPR